VGKEILDGACRLAGRKLEPFRSALYADQGAGLWRLGNRTSPRPKARERVGAGHQRSSRPCKSAVGNSEFDRGPGLDCLRKTGTERPREGLQCPPTQRARDVASAARAKTTLVSRLEVYNARAGPIRYHCLMRNFLAKAQTSTPAFLKSGPSVPAIPNSPSKEDRLLKGMTKF